MNTLKLFYLTTTLVFSLSLYNANAQQQGSYLVPNGLGAGGAPSVIELDDNRTLLVGYSSYGYDSSYVSMVWLDENFAVTSHKEFRLILPLNFVFHAVRCGDEILIGTLEYSSFGTPISLIRTDLDGNVLRYDLAFNNPEFQEKIKQIVANEDGSFAAYTSKSGSVGEMYRIDGNIADTIYHTKKISPVIEYNYFRPFNACNIDGNGTHLLTGHVNDYANQNQNAFMMKMDSAQIHWCKSFDYGAPSSEQAEGIIKLANGNFAFVGVTYNTVTTHAKGVVTVTDASGAHVWSKAITRNVGGILLYVVVETATGDLLVFGNNNNSEGIMVKLSATGDVIWKRKYTGMGYAGFSNAIRRENDQILVVGVSGNFLLNELDADGNGCQWADDATIEVADVTPTIMDVEFQYTNDVIPFSPQTVKPRNLSPYVITICATTDIENQDNSTSANRVFPNPAGDVCYLTNSTNELQPYAIYDLFGKKVLDGQFRHQTTLSLNGYPHGVYLVRIYGDGGEEVVRVVR